MNHRDGWKAASTELRVHYYAEQVKLPWSEVRPLVACAFRHVQREAFRDHSLNFITRCLKNVSELHLHKAHNHYGGWWGRNMGIRSRVFIGKLHTEPQKTCYPNFKDMPVFWHRDWKEHLVGLVAHELWHRWQPGHGKKAEYVCELIESDAIDTYRKEQGYTFTPPTEFEPEPQAEPEPQTELVNT